MSIPLSLAFSASVSRISPVPPPNSVVKHSRKFLLMASNASTNFRLGDLIDFPDRLLGVADRIDQVLPLRGEELLALKGDLVLFERRRIDRPQRFDLGLHFLVEPLGFAERFCVERVLEFRKLRERNAQFLPAGLVEEPAARIGGGLRPLPTWFFRACPASMRTRSSLSASSTAASSARLAVSSLASSATCASR